MAGFTNAATGARRTSLHTVWVLALLANAACTRKSHEPRAVIAAPAPFVATPSTTHVTKPAPRPASWQTPAPFARLVPSTKAVDAGAVSAPIAEAPKGPPPDAMNKALQLAMPALARCFQGRGGGGTVNVRFEAEPSGRARGIRISGADDRAESCIRSTMLTVALPSFDGPAPVEVDFPMTLAARDAPPVEHAVEVPGPR